MRRRHQKLLAAAIEGLESRRLLSLYGADVSFGNGGTTEVMASRGVQELSDGKLLVNGSKQFYDEESGDSSYVEYYQTRLNADGTIDKTYGKQGTIDIGSLAPMRRGSRYYVFENGPNLQQIGALTTNFTPDTSFAGDGQEPIPYVKRFSGDVVYVDGSDVDLMADGDLLVTYNITYHRPGDKYEDYYEIVRLNPNGSVDSSWADHGYLQLGKSISSASVTSNGIYVFDSGPFAYDIRRFKLDGTPDRSFGGDGTADRPGGSSAFTALADGKLLYARDVGASGKNAYVMQRLNADGSQDKSFGTRGSVSLDPPGVKPSYSAPSYAIDPIGRIWANSSGRLFRLSANGVPDAAPFNGMTEVNGSISGF